MVLLFDIGNTRTHLGLGNRQRVIRQASFPTEEWFARRAEKRVVRFVARSTLQGAVLASVVPRVTPLAQRLVQRHWRLPCLELTAKTACGIGIDYPQPETIGPDRLANAIAVKYHYGAPAIAVDLGTATTFDLVNRAGSFAGGIIAPGLSVMTSYLSDRTALLPKISIREVSAVIGKSTQEAMLIGLVHGYRGLVRELLLRLRRSLRCRRVPVVVTGGCAEFVAAKLPEITAVEPLLTLEGLRLVWAFGRHDSMPDSASA
jgi:type III pantothenate kinase